MRISGLTLDVIDQVAYKSDARAEQWVTDAASTSRKYIGVPRDPAGVLREAGIHNDAAGQAEVIRKKLAPCDAKGGEQQKFVLGIDSWLERYTSLIHILEALGWSDVQVFYNITNSTQMGYNVPPRSPPARSHTDIQVPREGENGSPPRGEGRVKLPAVQHAIDDIGWFG